MSSVHLTTRNLVTRNIVNQMLYERVGELYSLPAYLENTARKGITVISGIFHICDIFLLLALLLPFSLSHNMLFCVWNEWKTHSRLPSNETRQLPPFPSCSS